MLAQLIPSIARIILWIASHPYGRTIAVEGITRVAVRAGTRTIQKWPQRVALPDQHARSLGYAHGKRRTSHILDNIRQKLLFRRASSGASSQEQQALKSRIRRRVLVIATLTQLAVAWRYPFKDPWEYADDEVLPSFSNDSGRGWPSPALKTPIFSATCLSPSDPDTNRTEKANPIEKAWTEFRRTLKADGEAHEQSEFSPAWHNQLEKTLRAEWNGSTVAY